MAGDQIIVSWDTALSEKELASYSVAVVMQGRGETVYVLEILEEAGLRGGPGRTRTSNQTVMSETRTPEKPVIPDESEDD